MESHCRFVQQHHQLMMMMMVQFWFHKQIVSVKEETLINILDLSKPSDWLQLEGALCYPELYNII